MKSMVVIALVTILIAKDFSIQNATRESPKYSPERSMNVSENVSEYILSSGENFKVYDVEMEMTILESKYML